jgi:signal transduction histidine kinase
MKHLSIKLRVTLWYTFLMILVVGSVLIFMMLISSTVIEKDVKSQLSATVNSVGNSLSMEDHDLDLDLGFSLFQNQVYTLLYYENKTYLKGDYPDAFDSKDLAFTPNTIRSIKNGDRNYYVVDRLFTVTGEENSVKVWVRGVIEADMAPNLMESLFEIALFTLPFLVLIAAIGGYLISRQAFKPIDHLMKSANDINDGGDLSKRIGLKNNHDEIGKLASTFDLMLSRLENAFEAEKQFTSDASHELRTPVTVILAQSELAQASAKTLEEHQEALNVIHRQATKISHLITQLLSFTRLDQMPDPLKFDQVDLSELALAVCAEQSEAWKSSISLISDIQNKIRMKGDSLLLGRLMNNLIDNAYQYGKENGTIKVSLKKQSNAILFTVEDDGIGISPTDQDKIFNRFYQADTVRTTSARGSSGLGLAMVKKIAMIHGGDIRVESQINQGSKFIVKFLLK